MLSKKWCAQYLDGTMTDHRAYVSGCYRGYNIVTYEINGRSIQIVSIAASSERDAGGAELNTYVNTLLPLHRQFKAAAADGHSVTLSFVVATPGAFVRLANEVIEKIVAYLEENGYSSGCTRCGAPSVEELYHVNGRYIWLCAECAEKYRQELEQNKVNVRTRSSNLLGGLVGAALGALIGAALYVLVYQIGFIAGICGFVMAVLAMKFYEKLGGCLDLKGVIVSIAVVLVAVFFANRLAWAVSAYRELRHLKWDFFDCYNQLDYIIETTELQSSYVSDLTVGYLLTAVGCVRSFITAIKGSTGSFSIKKMDQ